MAPWPVAPWPVEPSPVGPTCSHGLTDGIQGWVNMNKSHRQKQIRISEVVKRTPRVWDALLAVLDKRSRKVMILPKGDMSPVARQEVPVAVAEPPIKR